VCMGGCLSIRTKVRPAPFWDWLMFVPCEWVGVRWCVSVWVWVCMCICMCNATSSTVWWLAHVCVGVCRCV